MLLAVAAGLAGQQLGGVWGAVIGAVLGSLAGAAAGFLPSIRDSALREAEVLAAARRELDRAADPIAGLTSDALGETAVGLLHPRRGIVGFAGRQQELAELTSWCGSARRSAVQLLTGAGGVGKTRLALRLAEEMTRQDWECRLVNVGHEVQVVRAARAVFSSCRLLLVVDYAETREDLDALLEDVAADLGGARVLLVARAAGEWWYELKEQSSSAVRKVLRGARTMVLDQPIDEHFTDMELAEQAAAYFRRERGGERLPAMTFRGGVERLPVLVLHAAALASVVGARERPGDAVALDRGMLDELLEHEAIYWRGTAQRRPSRRRGSAETRGSRGVTTSG